MRMPASSARNCSSFSRSSSGDGCSDDEALQRRAAVSVDADVVIERTLAVGRGRAREVESAQAARTGERRADDLHHVGIGALLRLADLGGERGDVGRRRRQRRRQARNEMRLQRRQVALQVDDDVGRAVRIDAARPPRRCGRSPRRDRRASSKLRRRPPRSAATISSHRSPRPRGPASAAIGAAPHVHDHRLAGDIDHRLAGQPRRRHARGDYDECIASLIGSSAQRLNRWQLVSGARHLERSRARLQAEAEFL